MKLVRVLDNVRQGMLDCHDSWTLVACSTSGVSSTTVVQGMRPHARAQSKSVIPQILRCRCV